MFLLRPPHGEGGSAFFDHAGVYYRQQPGVVLVVDSARSLLQVRELLQRSPLRGAQPWGRIVLVAHGSRWTGPSLPIFDGEGVPPPGRWREVLERGEFVPLAPPAIDAATTLTLESCGLGTRPELLRTLGALLGGSESPLPVQAARGLVEFRIAADGSGRASRHERRYSAQVRPRTRAAVVAWTDARRRRHFPVQFEQPLAAARGCAGLQVAALLAPRLPMGQRLADYGLRPAQLHWQLLPDGEGCLLRGQAELVVDARSGDWLPLNLDWGG